MEEEGARRRAVKGGANRGFLGGLNEEDEDSSMEQDEHVVAEARQRHGEGEDDRRSRTTAGQQQMPPQGAGAKIAAKRAVQGGTTHTKQSAPIYDGRAGQRDRGTRRTGNVPFELDMQGATLLGRRHKRVGGDGQVAMSSPLANTGLGAATRELLENPGSPMRVD